jgi:putative transport protein
MLVVHAITLSYHGQITPLSSRPILSNLTSMSFVALVRWPGEWLGSDSVAMNLVQLSIVAAVGLVLGAIRVRGIRLGISGVLFSALLFGQAGLTIDPAVLGFLRDFSLVLFMYAIGLEIGPAFLSSLRAEGLRLNVLTAVVITCGAGLTVLICRMLPLGAPPGVFVGAFTSTAALATAQETLRATAGPAGPSAAARAALAYSITYPFGIVGPMLVIQLLRTIFRVSVDQERNALALADRQRHSPIESVDLEITGPDHIGRRLSEIPLLRDNTVLLSRMLRNNVISIPTGQTQLQLGDVYRAVGPRTQLDQLVSELGQPSAADLSHKGGDIDRTEIIVTRTHVLHRPLRDLDLVHRTGYTIATVNRAGVNLVPNGSLRLAFADHVVVVGPKAGLKVIEAELGNSPEILDQPRLIPIFLGIVLGVLVGTFPLIIPGIHSTVRVGLAGGPLIIAIILAQLGSVGSIVWYMAPASNRLIRDFGLAIFLACVGLQAGQGFIQRAATPSGAAMLICGALVTVLPIFVIACIARKVLRINFITLTGWIAGTMGSSTTLLFASDLTQSESPSLAYAAVTPVATLLPILLAQFLVMMR